MEHDLDVPVIELDHRLLGEVLTEYGHLKGHISFTDDIEIDDVVYDEISGVLTAFVKIIKQPVN